MRKIFLALFLLCSPATAAFEVPGFELVVTDPVETTLVTPDLRDPTTVWCEMFGRAKTTIDLGQMYASGQPGEPLEEVIGCLKKAAKRGVKIRMLLEDKMQVASEPETLAALEAIPGLALRTLEFGKLSPGGIIHSKYIVVDGKEAFVGSQNFDWRALKHIHETGLLVKDAKIAGQIGDVFEHDWKAWALLKAGKKVPARKTPPVAPEGERAYLVASPKAFNPKGVGDSEAELLRLIGQAKDEIRIQLLDYYPLNRDKTLYPQIDVALRGALSRKVRVKLMVSHWNLAKPGVDYLKSLAVLPGAEVRVVTIPELKEGFLPFARVNHSKYMSIDGKLAWIGTSNWTGGYLDKSRNLEIVVKDAALAQRLDALHEQMWSSPYSAAIEIGRDYPPPRKGP